MLLKFTKKHRECLNKNKRKTRPCEGPCFMLLRGVENAACGDGQRRTRKWATPHAEFAIAARGVFRTYLTTFFLPFWM